MASSLVCISQLPLARRAGARSAEEWYTTLDKMTPFVVAIPILHIRSPSNNLEVIGDEAIGIEAASHHTSNMP